MYPSYQESTTHRARQSKLGLVAKLHDALRLLASIATQLSLYRLRVAGLAPLLRPLPRLLPQAASLLTRERRAGRQAELRELLPKIADRFARSILLLQRTPPDFTDKGSMRWTAGIV